MQGIGLALSFGYKVIESPAMVKQWRFPRSKKRRIRHKWACVAANFRPSDKVLIFQNCIVCHPLMARKIRSHFASTR